MAENIVQVTEGSGKKLHTWDRTIGANLVQDEFTLLGEYPYATYSLHVEAIAAATAASHMLQIMAGASLNVYIRRIWLTQHNLATATSLTRILLTRLSTAGTGGTAATPAPYDTTDAASGATGMSLPTVKGTETTTIRQDDIYTTQTASTAGGIAPGLLLDFTGHHAKSPRIPAGTTNGLAIKNISADATLSFNLVVEFIEASF